MPVGIVDNLDPSGPSNIPAKQFTESAVPELASAVKTGLDYWANRNNTKALGSVSDQLSSLEESQARYNVMLEQLDQERAAAASENRDAAYLTELNGKYRKLRAGEVQGALPPSHVRLKAIEFTRDAVNKYPQLQDEIFKIRDTVIDNVRQNDYKVASDPESQAEAELLKAAVTAGGGDYSQGIRLYNIGLQTRIMDQQLELKQRFGKLKFNDVAEAARSDGREASFALLSQVEAAYSKGIADPGWITQAGIETKIALGAQIDERIKAYTADGKLEFDPAQIKALKDEANQAVDLMIANASRFDSMADKQKAATLRKTYLESQKQALENGRLEAFIQSYGWTYGPVFAENPDFFVKWMEKLTNTVDAARQSKDRDIGPYFDKLIQSDPTYRFGLTKDGNGNYNIPFIGQLYEQFGAYAQQHSLEQHDKDPVRGPGTAKGTAEAQAALLPMIDSGTRFDKGPETMKYFQVWVPGLTPSDILKRPTLRLDLAESRTDSPAVAKERQILRERTSQWQAKAIEQALARIDPEAVKNLDITEGGIFYREGYKQTPLMVGRFTHFKGIDPNKSYLKTLNDAFTVLKITNPKDYMNVAREALGMEPAATPDEKKNPLMREPTASENKFFKDNPNVGGMAAADNKVILNPYSKLSPTEKEAVALNETGRIYMRKGIIEKPSFELTPEQKKAFKDYGSEDDIRQTIAARIMSGDPSAINPTKEQKVYAEQLREVVSGDYGLRKDGTRKGTGFLGALPMTDGSRDFMTEVSVGVNFDGKEVEIPTLVPTLTKEEVDYIRAGGDPTKNKSIMDKAVEHARKRIAKGLSPFANDGPPSN